MDEYITNIKDAIHELLINYIDIDFTLWLSWLLMPLVITFLLPLVIVILLYVSALIVYSYKLHWNYVRTAFDSEDRWSTARKVLCVLWDSHGWIWHGYEVTGLDNIPHKGAALIIYYHGAIPIDIYYLLSKVFMYRNRIVHTVADYFLFNIPGFSVLAECLKVVPGTIQSCANILKEGNLLAIAPGGVYESQFSHNYNLMWKKRLGFAKVALEAKVPIIPMFTENVREAFRTVTIGKRFFLKLYAMTKFPFTPLYGGFPVKMVTHFGEPINYDPNLSPEELQAKVGEAINKLISKHQRLPGSITHGILERIPYFRNKKKLNNKSK